MRTAKPGAGDGRRRVVRISYSSAGCAGDGELTGETAGQAYARNALGLMSSHRHHGGVVSWRYTPRGLLAAHTDEEARDALAVRQAGDRADQRQQGAVRFSHDADGRLVRGADS